MIHTKTRKRELVDQLFDLGLSVSYDRVLEISTELGNKVCHYYQTQKAVCPPQLKCGLFTTDNTDHNPSSTSARDSFHGTGISLFQHPDSTCSIGTFSRTSFPMHSEIPKASYVCLKLTQVFHPKQLVSSRTHQAKKELKAPLSPSFYHKPFQKNTGENPSFIHPKTYSFFLYSKQLVGAFDSHFGH